MDTNQLRQTFLNYFASRDHTIVPSSSLVPANDPTLLFTNAGMNQFKDVFLDRETRPYTRAASVQCCMRISGKHNDLESVGYTTKHHTFFEMLGNFSFGDYFKHEAINYAWEFLTEVLKISPEKLRVSVYEKDKEAEEIWLNKIKINSKHLSCRGDKDNFWSMGDTGPCGPNSEIFYDYGEDFSEEERYVELWNLVFMQYNRSFDGSITPLPQQSIDTGMGLERIAAVMQNTNDNYEIDIFQNLIKEILTLTEVKDKFNVSLRVIADHIRAAAFLIADDIFPSNEGRGYVLRHIIRRAIRHANKLSITEPFFYKLVKPLKKQMGSAYPKLVKAQKLIERTLYQEEEQFAVTLNQGLKILNQEISKLTSKIIPGDVAFRLYDTYGFPLDLTRDIAKEQGLIIDEQGFKQEMVKQRETSRSCSKFAVDYGKLIRIKGKTEFVGYDKLTCKSSIMALFRDDQAVKSLLEGDQGIVILDYTPFYAEAGGQIGDSGSICTNTCCFQVNDTKKQGDIYLHYGFIKQGKFNVGDEVNATVDANTRQDISINHTTTHLLHAALRQILGSHVEQKGSLVSDERLRFDFSHFEALTTQQIQTVETLVNQNIRANLPVKRELMTFDQAKKKDVIALFEGKYANRVCVVSIGDLSAELCGGTHINATGEVGLFLIISEEAIAAGIRRIEAITGRKAYLCVRNMEAKLKNAASLLKTEQERIIEKLQQILQHDRDLDKELTQLKNQLAIAKSNDLIASAIEVNKIKVIAAKLKNVDSKIMRSIIDKLRQQLGSCVILLGTVVNKKVQLVAGVSGDCTDKLNANELIQHVTKQISGKGGGRSDMAQGSGTNVMKLDVALDSVKNWVAKKIS
ncbi:MAG: alanyl-tRNA synthetase [Coxiella sp. DG_40]|nr:MAG: alanyl-tRNA synthetase [Coxiella sp. DG_40]